MANSGIALIDTIFNWAVYALVWLAQLLGISYEEINVWLFCVAWPLVTVLLVAIIWKQRRELKSIKQVLSHG